MTVTLGCVIGVPFLYISDLIVRKIGSVNVFVVAFVIYCVRFFGYSLIWYVFIISPRKTFSSLKRFVLLIVFKKGILGYVFHSKR